MIPKKIHQIWVGPNPIPKESIQFIEKIKHLHPEFEYKLWTDTDLTQENFTNFEIIQKTQSYAQKADIMRYEILYRHGGIYLDMDMEVFQSLAPLLTHSLIICNEDNKKHYMTNAFIAASQNNENMLRCIKNIQSVNFNLPVNQATGPYYFRRNILIDDTVRQLPTHFIYPVHWTQKDASPVLTNETYTNHHWDKNW